MSRLWTMATTLTTRRHAAGGVCHPQPGPERTCQMESPRGGAPASPLVFVQGKAAPTGRGVAAASQTTIRPGAGSSRLRRLGLVGATG